MPTYTVTDPQTNKTLKLIGDSPPTEAELVEIFAAQAQAPVSQDPYDVLTASQRNAGAIQQQGYRDAEKAREAAIPFEIGGAVIVFIIGVILILKLAKSRPLRLLPLAARSASKTKDQIAFDCSDPDAEFFAVAEEEMVSGNHDKATWAQALVKANGNEEKRRAEYILLRVRRMRLKLH